MKPAPFEFLRPRTTAEALELLAGNAGDARILAGGQSLVPMLNFRLARFAHLIDLNEIGELSYITADAEWLRIGAMTRYRAIETSRTVAQAAPLLAEATKFVAHLPVRTRGTIGGSLAHADPGAEYPAVMLALDAKLGLRSVTNERVLEATDFFQGIFSTALQTDELLVEVQLPVARPHQVFGFEEFARRPGDLAVIGVAIKLDLEGDRAAHVRIVTFGGPHGACRVEQAETELEGRVLTIDRINAAAEAAGAIETHSDIHATAALRQRLAKALTRRLLTSRLSARVVLPT